MAKFEYNFKNSTYSKLWDSKEGQALLVQILNDPELIRSNFNFWRTKFQVDPAITPTGEDGTAVFKSELRELGKSHLMDWRAPLGDSYQEEKAGLSRYTGIIPDFIARGTVEKATEREYRERKYRDAYGDDAALVLDYAKEIQVKVDSADQTLSHLAAQLLSTGQIVYNAGLGLKGGVYHVDTLPATNWRKAGEKAWSDPTCQLLTQMAAKEKEIRDELGTDAPFQWEIPYDVFHNIVLKNAEVKAWVASFRKVNELPWLETGGVVTEKIFREAIAAYEGISPIVVISEKQRDVETMVSGWKANTVVFRPAGFAGLIRHTDSLDELMHKKYGATDITKVFSRGANGLYTIVNSTLNNGNYKEWHIDLFMSAVPSLDEFLYHFFIDITTADE